jgi:PAS domain S-box-containing protein
MTANVLESILCASLILYFSEDFQNFKRVREVTALIAGALLINGLTACIGAGTSFLFRGASFREEWWTWYSSDSLGILLVAPFIVSFITVSKKTLSRLTIKRFLEALIYIIIWIVVIYLVFYPTPISKHFDFQPYYLVAVLALPAIRFGIRGITLVLILLFIFAIFSPAILNGPSPWALSDKPDNLAGRLVEMQFFIEFLAIVGYLLATGFQNLMRTEKLLKGNNEQLLAAKIRAEESEKNLLMKNEEYEALNEELRQSNDELVVAKNKSEENYIKYSSLFENSRDGIVLVHFDGGIISCNRAFSKIVGYTEAELQKMSFYQLTPEKWHQWERTEIVEKQLMANGFSETYEKEYIHKNGKVFPIELTAYVIEKTEEEKIEMWGVVRDISELKAFQQEIIAAKEKAEKSEKRYRTAQEVGHVGSWEYDIENNIFWGSDEAKRIYGFDLNTENFSAEEVMTRVQERASVDQALIDLIQENKPYNIVFDIIPKNSTVKKTIHSVAELIRDENGQPLKVTGVLHDITEQNKAERELIAAKEKAEESDTLKTIFLQNMSHEIRTPMNAICGFSKMLDNPKLSGEKRQNFVSIIINSSNQLLSIISDILAISAIETKQEKVNLQEVRINDVVADLLAIFKNQAAAKSISFGTKQTLSDKESEIYADKTKITQILSNLIGNALKFTHQGFIEFGYSVVGTSRDLSVPKSGDLSELNEIQFYVKDSGIGIQPEMQEKIFERFRQADINIQQNYGGTGLGLSISQGFAELMGGRIWVESESGKGSTFYFTIPYNPVFENKKIRNPEKFEKNDSRKIILVAEDDDYNYLYLEEVLKT